MFVFISVLALLYIVFKAIVRYIYGRYSKKEVVLLFCGEVIPLLIFTTIWFL